MCYADYTRKLERVKFLLRHGSGITVDHLSAKLEISRRPVLRMIAVLKQMNVNIKYSRSHRTYYIDSSKDNYSLSYASIVVPLVKAVQEQQKMIDSLQNQINQITGSGNRAINFGSTLTPTSSINVELNNSDAIVLNDAVPNPFAEQTLITYNIPQSCTDAQIIFYDYSGKLIKVVDIKTKGRGQLNVFANDLTSGIYSFSLIIDGKVHDTKKMIKQ